MKVSFDFDNTLDTEQIQKLCKKYIKLGADVFITTSRAEKFDGKTLPHEDLYQLTETLGIKKENITFTTYRDKYEFVKDMDIHIDDDIEQVFLINQHHGKCIAFLFEENHNNGYLDM